AAGARRYARRAQRRRAQMPKSISVSSGDFGSGGLGSGGGLLDSGLLGRGLARGAAALGALGEALGAAFDADGLAGASLLACGRSPAASAEPRPGSWLSFQELPTRSRAPAAPLPAGS